MKLLDCKRLVIEPIERIGRVFPKGRLTLAGGLPGSGKTTSVLRELNKDGIIPLWFNLDESGKDDDIKAEQFGTDVFKEFIANIDAIEDIDGSVIVIDTYIRAYELIQSIDSSISNEKIVSLLEYVCSKYNATLIIIGHTQEYVGRDGIFKDNELLVRNCYEYIYIDKQIKQETDRKTKNVSFFVSRVAYVNKARAYDGDIILTDFGSKKGD